MAAPHAEPHWAAPPRRLPPARRLRPGERARLAAEIVAAYLQARRELRRAPIESAIAALRSEIAPARLAAAGGELAEAQRLGWVVTRTLRLMPGDTRCLARSLVLTRLLARRGIPAKLVIGARAAPAFLAHAWVEYDGQPVLSPGDGSFGRLVEL
ncbi:MAG: lasso peptide biosynthesis B2 protein [Solirubrobacterales bacterium]